MRAQKASPLPTTPITSREASTFTGKQRSSARPKAKSDLQCRAKCVRPFAATASGSAFCIPPNALPCPAGLCRKTATSSKNHSPNRSRRRQNKTRSSKSAKCRTSSRPGVLPICILMVTYSRPRTSGIGATVRLRHSAHRCACRSPLKSPPEQRSRSTCDYIFAAESKASTLSLPLATNPSWSRSMQPRACPCPRSGLVSRRSG